MSWKKRALDKIAEHEIHFEDRSTSTDYLGYMRAPFTNEIILFAEENELTLRERRFKGSDKSHFWYKVFCVAEGGVCEYQDWYDNVGPGTKRYLFFDKQ